MSKITPRPWQNEEGLIVAPGFGVVGRVFNYRSHTAYGTRIKEENATANATLIAAAPNLLYLLKCAVEALEAASLDSYLTKNSRASLQKMAKMMTRSIDKAEGK